MLEAIKLYKKITNEKVSDVSLIFESFRCNPKGKDVETFFNNHMLDYEYASKSRSYIIVDEEILAGSLPIKVYGYFTLSLKDFNVDEDVFKSKNHRKNVLKSLSGFPYSIDNTHFNAYLIGQLGKNIDINNNPVSGSMLIEEAIERVSEAIPVVGGRLVLIECSPELKEFYQNHEFFYVSQTTSSKGAVMLQMVRKVEITL